MARPLSEAASTAADGVPPQQLSPFAVSSAVGAPVLALLPGQAASLSSVSPPPPVARTPSSLLSTRATAAASASAYPPLSAGTPPPAPTSPSPTGGTPPPAGEVDADASPLRAVPLSDAPSPPEADARPPADPSSDKESSSSSDSEAAGDPPAAAANRAALVCVAIVDAFPPTANERVEKDRWRKVRLFLSALLAEPAFNIFAGCNVGGVVDLAHSLIGGTPSSTWINNIDCIQQVVFIWEFLLLMRLPMDQSRDLSRAIGELLLFSIDSVEVALAKWEAAAGDDAKAYRDQWQETSPEKYQDWLLAQGASPPLPDMASVDESVDRVVTQLDEERTGQVWPGRAAVRAYMDDKTSERDRKKAAVKRAKTKNKKKKPKPSWEKDDCRHYYPPDVLRAPGVMTFMCPCGYIIGFELLRETESPAHVVAALAQRFKVLPKVVYFDTACQAQRNAIRRVPWLLHEAVTAWFIDRFHRCNHKCSPTFDADQYPELSRGHDTSGAERQHSIKKNSKNSLSYMTQKRFIVRSRYIAAHNNVRVSQRRDAVLSGGQVRAAGVKKRSKEIQHFPVEAYYHKTIVAHCEVPGCTCRETLPLGPAPGLMQKV